MKSLKKVIICIALSCLAVNVWADKKSDIINAVNNSSAYYYGEKNGVLMSIRITRSGSESCLERVRWDVNLQKKTKTRGSISETTLYSSYVETLYNQDMEIKNGTVQSFKDWDDTYTPVPKAFRSDEQIFQYMLGKLNNKFDRCLGTYTDEITGRVYKIERLQSNYKITISYPKEDYETLVDILKIYNNFYLYGDKLMLFFYASDQDSTFSINEPNIVDKSLGPKHDCRCADEEELGHRVSFLPKAFVNSEGVAEIVERTVELFHTQYYFSENGEPKSIYFNSDSAIVLKVNPSTVKFEKEKEYRAYKIFVDSNGWKSAQVGERNFLFVDGENFGFAFAYKGKSLMEDSDAVISQFKEKQSSDETYINLVSGANGLDIKNPLASSTLTDKYHKYSAYGALNTFISGKRNYWIKNNIPWVEGKADDGIGESMEFDISAASKRGRVGYYLDILGGYVDPLRPHLFKQNNRIKKLLVETDAGFSEEMEFNDSVEFARIRIPVESTHVKLTIKEVYKGTKYSDTCLSAVMLNDEMWER